MWLFIELRQLLLRVFIYVDLSKRTFWKTLEQTFPQIPSWGSRATCDCLFFGWHGYESLVKVNTSPPIGCWKHQHNIMYYIHSSQCVVVAMAILPNMLQNMLLNMGTGHCIHIIFRQCFFKKKLYRIQIFNFRHRLSLHFQRSSHTTLKTRTTTPWGFVLNPRQNTKSNQGT